MARNVDIRKSMKITRHVHKSRGWSRQNDDLEQLLAVIPASRPLLFADGSYGVDPDGEHRIVYTSLGAKVNGWHVDSIVINGTIFQDLGDSDTFCAELFFELTGVYPFECEDMDPVFGDIVWG